MWTIIVLAIILATALGNTVPYQYTYPQGYMSDATYTGFRGPSRRIPWRRGPRYQLLDTFSNICPNCLKGEGVDEVTGIPGLKDEIEHEWYRVIKPAMNEILDNVGKDKVMAYRYLSNLCENNQHIIELLPGGDVLKMFCFDIDLTLKRHYYLNPTLAIA